AEELESAVLAVGHDHGPVRSDVDPVRDSKLSRAAARLAPGEQVAAVGRELVDARVTVAVGDVQGAVRGQRDVRREMERRPGAEEPALPVEDDDRVLATVEDVDPVP